MSRNRKEHEAQCAVIRWSQYARQEYPDLKWLFAVPNAGVGRSPKQGKDLKDEGLRKGVLDLYLLKARGGYFGLAIEMKIKPRKLTDEQAIEIPMLIRDGYLAQVAWSSAEAIEILCAYLKMPKTQIHVQEP